MKTIIKILIIVLTITVNSMDYVVSATKTWSGNISTDWNNSGNWVGGVAADSSDNIVINSNAPNNLVLTQNQKITNLTINGDTLDLGGYTFEITGTAYFNSGLVKNGLLKPTGSLCHFGGATLDARIEATCGYFHMNSGVYKKPVFLTSTGAATSSSTYGNHFEDSLTITNNGAVYFNMGSSGEDIYDGPVVLYNNSSKEIRLAITDTSYFNNNIIVNASGGVEFGVSGGVSILGSGKTISVGTFSSNYLTLSKFIQLGSTAQTLSLSGTGVVSLENCTFNGNLTINAPGILTKSSTYYGNTTFNRTGSATNFHSYGLNVYAGNVTWDNAGNGGRIRLASTAPDTYLGDATFSSSGGQDLQVAYVGDNTFAGNITINSNKVVFNTSTGKVTFTGTNSQSLNGSYNYAFENIALNKSAGTVTANTTLSVDDSLIFIEGNLITTSTNLLTMKHGSTATGASNSSFVSGPVKKVGNTAFVFTVGSGITYRPLTITAPSNTSDAFTAEYYNAGQTLGTNKDTTITFVSDCGYWKLERTTGTSNITPKFAFDSLHCDYLNVKPVHIAFWNGTKWTDTGEAVSESSNKMTSTAMTSYGYFSFSYLLMEGENYRLPVQLNADSICQSTEIKLQSKEIWIHISPDSLINRLMINRSILNGKNYAYIESVSIYSSYSHSEKTLTHYYNYSPTDSTQSDIVISTVLDSSKSYFILIKRVMEENNCTFCNDDSSYLNICIANRNQNIASLNQFPPQNPSWSQPPFRIDFNSGIPNLDPVYNLPITPIYSHNIQQDLNGDILFYIVDGIIYDSFGSLVQEIECNCYNNQLLHGKSEFLIVPVPGNCNQYYLISGGLTSSVSQGDPKPYYVIYDLSTGEVLGMGGNPGDPAIPLPSYFNNALHHGILHFAATPEVNNERFLFVSSTETIFRYKINNAGIYLDNSASDGGIINLNADLGFYANASATMRSEMEVLSYPDNTILSSALFYKIAVPFEGYGLINAGSIRNHIMIAELNINGEIIPGSTNFIDLLYVSGTSREVKGLEFSPDGQFLYVITTFAPYLFYVDLNASTPTLLPLLNGAIPNIVDFKNSQLELAYDGKLYLGSGNRMASINDPNNPTITTVSDPATGLSTFSFTTTVGNGGTGEELVVFPDQIDGEIYGFSLSPTVPIDLSSSVTLGCFGTPVTLFSNPGFAQYLWSTNETTQNISVSSSGIYTVIVTDAMGCKGKAKINMNIIDCCTGTEGTLTGDFLASQLANYPYYYNNPPRIESGFSGTVNNSGSTIALNGSLTIDIPDFEFRNLELVLGENTKIYFEAGIAKTLNFESNNYLHGCDGKMWDGIYVDFPNVSVEATDGNTWIEDAKNAIVSNNYGDFQLENVHFNKNWKGLLINMDATYSHPGRVYNNCKFTCEALYSGASNVCLYPHSGDITFRGIEINGPGIVQIGNSSFTANQFNNLKQGISSINVKRSRIAGCDFQNITDAGIYSYNSKLFILGNDFLNSQSGIKSSSSSSSLFYGHTIAGNTFTDIDYHIIDWAGKYHNIGPAYGYGKNYFGTFNSDPDDNIAGTYFIGTSAFNIVDNEFYRSKFGSIVFNSGSFGGRIDYLDEGNYYQDCKKAILGAGDNSKLTIHCNNFNTIDPAYYESNSWDFSAPASVLADQGSPVNDIKAPAGDRFFNQSANDLLGTSVTPFDYNGHDFNCTEIFVEITPGTGVDYFIYPSNCFGSDPDEPCKPETCPPPCNEHERIMSISGDIDSLETVYNNLDELIQTEDTENLLYEITNNGDEEDLSILLLAASPLSDSVLIELSRAHSSLTSGTLKNIFEVNSMLSLNVKNEIMNENTTLDSADKVDLMLLQGNYTLHPTLTGLSKHINHKKVTRQLYINDMIRHYADSDSVDAAVDALLLLGTETDIQTMFSTCMNLSLIETAQEIFGTLSEIETIDPDWILIQGLLLDLALNNQTVFDIDSTQHAMLYAIAEKTGASLATANSRSILKLVFNEEFNDDLEEESRYASNQIPMVTLDKKVKGDFLTLIPNPAKNQVTLSYNLTGKSEKANFEFYDVYGTLILEKEVSSGESQFSLQLTELSSGVYICIVNNGYSFLQKKLVITK